MSECEPKMRKNERGNVSHHFLQRFQEVEFILSVLLMWFPDGQH